MRPITEAHKKPTLVEAMKNLSSDIDKAKLKYAQFIELCRKGPTEFALTPRAEPTAFGRCFAVFGLHLLKQHAILGQARVGLSAALRASIREERERTSIVPKTKSYRQLLTFTLSALSILDSLDEDPLADLVIEQIPKNMDDFLRNTGALEGRPQSGNQAMFAAIFILHARDQLGINTGNLLDRWVSLHLTHMNRFGFWGADKGMQHLLFQNGYHQYEIFEYLGQSCSQLQDMVQSVRDLADVEGHFSPYPGGGGCYDYDAVSVLTQESRIFDSTTQELLLRTAKTLMAEQTSEGGWCESLRVRPRGFAQMKRFFSHTINALPNIHLLKERARYAIVLQRPYHDRIHTHWSKYSRKWNEADLWDSWFRLLAIARIQVAFEPEMAGEWGFINYPGIGYHPSLR